MYQKRQSKNTLKVFQVIAVLFVLTTIGIGSYYLLRKSEPNTDKTPPAITNATTGGVIATFNQDGTPVQAQEQQAETPETKAAVSFSTLPYTLTLPAGWSETASVNEASTCNNNDEWSTKTYTNSQETLIVYENRSPDGCELKSFADVYLDYDFSEDGTEIIINDSVIAQCSKEANPACPKGDGKVTIYLGNEDPEDPKKLARNSITNKSYFFSITDTKIDNDFEAQVRSLIGLVKSMKIE